MNNIYITNLIKQIETLQDEDDRVDFIKSLSPNLLLDIIERNVCWTVLSAIVSTGNHELILKILEEDDLDWQVQLAIIRTGNIEFIKSLLKLKCLSFSAESAIASTGNNELIKELLKREDLCWWVQKAIDETGNPVYREILRERFHYND